MAGTVIHALRLFLWVVLLLWMIFVIYASCLSMSVPCSLAITCWEKADPLALLCVVFSCVFCHIPICCPGSGVVLDWFNLCFPLYFYSENIPYCSFLTFCTLLIGGNKEILLLVGNCTFFLSSSDFFQNQLFRKLFSGIPLECQTIRIQSWSGSKLFAKVISRRHL